MSERLSSRREIAERLAHPEPEVRRIATQEIPRLAATDASDLLLTALGDEDWRVRKEAASVASQIEPRTSIVFTLARALGERDAVGLRNAAVEALVNIGPDSVFGAIDALGRLDGDGRKLAVEVLSGAPTLDGMRALRGALTDDDPNVVVAAAEGLAQAALAGEEARELARTALLPLLSDGPPHVRLAALDALARLEARVPWSALEPLVLDPLLGRAALILAAGSTEDGAIDAMSRAIGEASRAAARVACASLGASLETVWDDDESTSAAGAMILAHAGVHERLRAFAADVDDAQLRGAALLALGAVGDPSDIGLLAEALADDVVADRAEAALRRFGHDAVGPLLAQGRTADPFLRGATISMLPSLTGEGERFPSEAGASIQAVRDALTDGSSDVVVASLRTLAVVGDAGDLPRASALVASSDAEVSAAAHGALSAIVERHPDAARARLAGTDPRGDAALSATVILQALAHTGRIESADRAFVLHALSHRDASVRRAALLALAEIGGDDAALPVTSLLADEEPAVAQAAVRALGRLGSAEELASLAATTRDPMRLGIVLRALFEADPERGFAAARPLVASSEPALAASAVEVVGSSDAPGRDEALANATFHPDHEVVKLALTHLANGGEERAIAALSRAIEHDAEAVRRYAAELLGNLRGSEEIERVLRNRVDRERSAEVRRVIMEALSQHSSETAP